MTTEILCKTNRESSSRNLRWVIYYTLYRTDPKKNVINMFVAQTYLNTFLHNNLNTLKITRPGFHLGAPQKRKVMITQISYKTYREILFQTVALGYLLHFVQNGSSKNMLKHTCLHNNLKQLKIKRPGFHLGATPKRKVMTN